MAASIVHLFSSVPASLSFSTDKNPLPTCSHCIKFFKPTSTSQLNPPSIRVYNYRSKCSGATVMAPRLSSQIFKVRGSVDNDSVTSPEPESDNSEAGATIDLRLPRRSMLVQFTCNLCGGRTQRLVNRLAYERGLVFVQCAGCLQHHKLVDNLGLITEYDFREETNMDSD